MAALKSQLLASSEPLRSRFLSGPPYTPHALEGPLDEQELTAYMAAVQ